jgi:hypothetical protein
MKRFFALLFAFVLSFSLLAGCDNDNNNESNASSAESEEESEVLEVSPAEDFVYIENPTGEGLIISYKGNDKKVVIPDKINGRPVSVIGINAFKLSNIESVIIPDTVTKINDSAFFNCSELTEIIFGKNIKEIGTSAFAKCTALKEIKLPANLETLKLESFKECSALESVTIPKTLTTWGMSAFLECTKLTNVILEEGITELGGYATFGNCAIEKITVPKSVTKIKSTFFLLPELKEVVFLGDLPNEIDSDAFSESLDFIIYYDPATSGWDTTILHDRFTLIPLN